MQRYVYTRGVINVQEIPLEEINADDNAKIVNLFHYAKDPSRPHGVPCKFVLREVSRINASD